MKTIKIETEIKTTIFQEVEISDELDAVLKEEGFDDGPTFFNIEKLSDGAKETFKDELIELKEHIEPAGEYEFNSQGGSNYEIVPDSSLYIVYNY